MVGGVFGFGSVTDEDGGHLPPPRTMTREQISQWVRTAQRGAELRYGRGFNAAQAAGVHIAAQALQLNQLGYVALVQRRRGVPQGQGMDYVMQRTAKPLAAKDRIL